MVELDHRNAKPINKGIGYRVVIVDFLLQKCHLLSLLLWKKVINSGGSGTFQFDVVNNDGKKTGSALLSLIKNKDVDN